MGPAARHICRRAGLLNIRFLIADLNRFYVQYIRDRTLLFYMPIVKNSWFLFRDNGNHCRLLEIILKKLKTLFVKLRQGSGKDWQGMAVKAKGLKA